MRHAVCFLKLLWMVATVVVKADLQYIKGSRNSTELKLNSLELIRIEIIRYFLPFRSPF